MRNGLICCFLTCAVSLTPLFGQRGDPPDRCGVECIEKGREAGLSHIYMGNAWGAGGEDTHCASCGAVVMRRLGFRTETMGLDGGDCSDCGAPLAGVLS